MPAAALAALTFAGAGAHAGAAGQEKFLPYGGFVYTSSSSSDLRSIYGDGLSGDGRAGVGGFELGAEVALAPRVRVGIGAGWARKSYAVTDAVSATVETWRFRARGFGGRVRYHVATFSRFLTLGAGAETRCSLLAGAGVMRLQGSRLRISGVRGELRLGGRDLATDLGIGLDTRMGARFLLSTDLLWRRAEISPIHLEGELDGVPVARQPLVGPAGGPAHASFSGLTARIAASWRIGRSSRPEARWNAGEERRAEPVAMVEFRSSRADPGDVEAVLEALRSELRRAPGLRLVPREATVEAVRGPGAGVAGRAGKAAAAARSLGASYALIATIREAGGSRLRIAVELYDAATGARLHEERSEGGRDAVIRRLPAAASRIAARIGS